MEIKLQLILKRVLMALLLSFGSGIIVLAPHGLQQRIAEVHQPALDMYACLTPPCEKALVKAELDRYN